MTSPDARTQHARRRFALPTLPTVLPTSLGLFLLSTATFAQDAATNATATAAAGDAEATFLKGINFQTMWEKGGLTVLVLYLLSLIGLTLVLYLFYALSLRNITPRSFLSDLRDLVRSARFQDARRACNRDKSPAAAMALAGLDYVEDAKDAGVLANINVLREAIESEGTRQARLIRNPTRYLNDIAIIAPMIGLFGTVFALFGTFSSAEKMVDLSPGTLASGIGYALMTTLVGLMVGIPARLFYGFFRNRATRVISNLEVVGSDLVGLFSHYMNRGTPVTGQPPTAPVTQAPSRTRAEIRDPTTAPTTLIGRVQDDPPHKGKPHDPREEYGLQ